MLFADQVGPLGQVHSFEPVPPIYEQLTASLRLNGDPTHVRANKLALGEGFRDLRSVLERLRTSYLLFEPHQANEVQMQNAYWNADPHEFLRFVQDQTGLDHVHEIGTAEQARPVYLLTSEG